MPAITTDIAAGIRKAAIADWRDDAIAARYPSARDGAAAPADGFFDLLADAEAVAAQRGVLIGAERRRFAVSIDAALFLDPSAGVPRFRLIDAEHAIDATHFPARIEVDLEAETTTLELFEMAGG